ncbi:DEAD/DEAH box helicase family protein, partial [Candidatus Gottesmanbacteria bacterium]|nr:DEAD/DEAH box helicase family protein [Candidatus Gottesmanbacteria bacterium]
VIAKISAGNQEAQVLAGKVRAAGGLFNGLLALSGQNAAIEQRVEAQRAAVTSQSGVSAPAAETAKRSTLIDRLRDTFFKKPVTIEEQAQRRGQIPKTESERTPLQNVNAAIDTLPTKEITENSRTVRVIDTAAITDPAAKQYFDGFNERMKKVQAELGFPLYGEDPKAPQDQLRNIVRAAIRGDESQFLIAAGGAGKTETSALAAAERALFSGRKQVLILESAEAIGKNKGAYESIFEAEGVKRFYLDKKVAELSPKDFADLQKADIIVTTNKIGYEWLPDYGRGAAHPENQLKFVRTLEGGKGFEFVVDEVKTIWDPSLRLAISGDPVVYATTEQGKRDIAALANTLGWEVNANGTVTVKDQATGSLTSLRDLATQAIQTRGVQGLKDMFDPVKSQAEGKPILRQDIRADAYRKILLELRAAHPEAAENINRLLGEFAADGALEQKLAANDTASLTAFEERLNGLSSTNLTQDSAMAQVRDEFLQKAGVMETLSGLYGDVVGNKYEPIRRVVLDRQGNPTGEEVLVVVPKDRNVFEGKQLSDGMQNLIYNTEGKRLYQLVSGKPQELNVKDVVISQHAQEITILEINSRARSTMGLSLEANEVAQVWEGAAAAPEKLGRIEVDRFLYGKDSQGNNVTVDGKPLRPLTGVYEVKGVAEINSRMRTRVAAEAAGKQGAFLVNVSNTEGSNIEVESRVNRQYGDSIKIYRNRNDLHTVEAVDSITSQTDGTQTVKATRLHVELVEVNSQQRYQLVKEIITRTTDTEGRILTETVTETQRSPQYAEKSPITLDMLDTAKLLARGMEVPNDLKPNIQALTDMGINLRKGFYVDFYEKGADIGVNPLSFENETLRVFGDRWNSSSEWYQGDIRARGNEGKTA